MVLGFAPVLTSPCSARYCCGASSKVGTEPRLFNGSQPKPLLSCKICIARAPMSMLAAEWVGTGGEASTGVKELSYMWLALPHHCLLVSPWALQGVTINQRTWALMGVSAHSLVKHWDNAAKMMARLSERAQWVRCCWLGISFWLTKDR